jgi:hypothetical protein
VPAFGYVINVQSERSERLSDIPIGCAVGRLLDIVFAGKL